MAELVDFILHIDEHLREFTQQHGALTYALLFGIVFCETGLVFMPLLPGDSLLFAAGALAADATYELSVMWIYVLLLVAAVLGDTVNYHIGLFFGPNMRFINKKHLERTQRFFEHHGGKTIILARFLPIIRTFAPFVAGIGKMNYGKFLAYNVVGGFLWVTIFLFVGYFFGTYDFVQQNFKWIVVAIIVISVLPVLYELVQAYRQRNATPASEIDTTQGPH